MMHVAEVKEEDIDFDKLLMEDQNDGDVDDLFERVAGTIAKNS